MPEFSTKRRVRHSASDMFALVADVESYPQFLPLCAATRVRQRTPKADGVEVLVADMTVAYKLIRESFTSRATLDPERRKILVEYLKGPFSNLENRWEFVPVGENSCDVHFYIHYEFRSRALGLLMGVMFETAFRKFSVAFEQRADRIYGRKKVG